MIRRILSFSLILIAINYSSIAQQIVKNINTTGTCRQGETETLESVKKRALNIAFENALLKAGIPIELRSVYSESINSINGNNNLSQFWDLQSSFVGGSILDYDTILYKPNGFEITAELWGAKVIKYSEHPDPNFEFEIDGLKESYLSSEPISFSFKPSQNGYLYIFTQSDEKLSVLYPYKSPIADFLSDNMDVLFNKDEKILFPINQAYKPGYSIELEENEYSSQVLMYFLYLKRNKHWNYESMSLKNFNKEVASISPDNRYQKIFIINIIHD